MASKKELFFPINTKIEDFTTGIIYTLTKLLGRGAYAQCFLAETPNTANGASNIVKKFAIKIILKKSLNSEKVKQKMESEIQIHKSLNHPNIIKMYSSFRTEDHIFMVLELAEKGGLDELLKKNKKIPEKYVQKFILQILKALEYLHNIKSVVHRDLKLGNLFLDSNCNIKIGDFGLSAIIENGEKRKTICGTPNYIAPEVLFGKASGHSFSADIWSLGVITYTLLIGTPPFQESSVEEIYKRIEQNKYIFPIGCSISEQSKDFISKILISEPEDRPDLIQLQNHKFISQGGQLVKRIYKNMQSNNFFIQEIDSDYLIYSFPIEKIKGIGYIFKSGIIGIFYQNNINIFLYKNKLRRIQPSFNKNKKIFLYDDITIYDEYYKNSDNLKEFIFNLISSNNINYMDNCNTNINNENINNIVNNTFCNTDLNQDNFNFNSIKNISNSNIKNDVKKELVDFNDNYINHFINLKYFIETFTNKNFKKLILPEFSENIFISRVKAFTGGYLFILTNNIFVFDFGPESRIIISKEGKIIKAMDDDGNCIEFDNMLKEKCLRVLNLYIK